jgi:hypothetical protein
MWGSGMEGSSESLVQVGRLYKIHAAEPFFDEVDEEAKRETPEFEAAEMCVDPRVMSPSLCAYVFESWKQCFSEAAFQDLGTAWYGDLLGNANVPLSIFSSCRQVYMIIAVDLHNEGPNCRSKTRYEGSVTITCSKSCICQSFEHVPCL